MNAAAVHAVFAFGHFLPELGFPLKDSESLRVATHCWVKLLMLGEHAPGMAGYESPALDMHVRVLGMES